MLFPLDIIAKTQSVVTEVTVLADDIGVCVVFVVMSASPGLTITDVIPVECA